MGNLRKKGAVSIFAVIFSALLLTVLTVSFIRIMIDEQGQATNNDLSQSAYDASLAGVEDAKRVINSCKSGGDVAACNAIETAENCQVINKARGLGAQPETVISSSSLGGGEVFDQAYTCVNITMESPDYLFYVAEGEVEVVPLRAVSEFNKIAIDWFIPDNAGVDQATAPGGGAASNDLLPAKSSWGNATPPVVRTQLITPGTSIDIGSLDSDAASQTAFIKPFAVQSGPAAPSNPELSLSPSSRLRASSGAELDNTVDTVMCSRDFAFDGNYACRVVLDLGRTISQPESDNAILRISTIYKDSSARVTLLNGSDVVQFNGVQPTVDSTGRANNLFRRVEARLQMGDDFPYPNYVVDVENGICKDFTVDGLGATPGACIP